MKPSYETNFLTKDEAIEAAQKKAQPQVKSEIEQPAELQAQQQQQ